MELEFLGVDAAVYGRLVLAGPEWERQTGLRLETLKRLEGGVLPEVHALTLRETAMRH
jgi:hypothetical protein